MQLEKELGLDALPAEVESQVPEVQVFVQAVVEGELASEV